MILAIVYTVLFLVCLLLVCLIVVFLYKYINDASITPEFKNTMHNYKIFFDEYCEFMIKYKNSGCPLSMLDEYVDFFNQYTKTLKKLSAIDKSKLSEAELKYYTEIATEIYQKLAKI